MPLTGAHGDKRYVFLVNTCAFYSSIASNQTCTDPSYPPIYFLLMPLEASSCFGMILDEGGGGGAIVMVVVGGAEVGRKYLGCTIIEYNTC